MSTDPPAHEVSRATLRAAIEERVCSAHPRLGVTGGAFVAWLEARLAPEELEPALATRHLEDLYLAYGCGAQDPGALATLERDVWPRVEQAYVGLRLAPAVRHDLLQALRADMIVGADGSPRIAKYDGRGPLVAWLRVCAVRLAQHQLRHPPRTTPFDDQRLAEVAPGVPDPELRLLRQRCAGDFQAAFAAALSDLSPRERNLLRHQVVAGLGIDQIAAIYHVHRATAARQLHQARARLVAKTRERLRAALRLDTAELESLLRLVESAVEVTVSRLLRGAPTPA